MSDIQKQPEHVDPVAKAIREHVAAPGDIYVTKNPGQYTDIYRLGERDDKHPECFRVTRLDPLTGEPMKEDGGYARDRMDEDQLRQYYRYLSHDLAETLSLARKVMDGDVYLKFNFAKKDNTMSKVSGMGRGMPHIKIS